MCLCVCYVFCNVWAYLGVLVTFFVSAWCCFLYCGVSYDWVLCCTLLKHCLVVFGECVGCVCCSIWHLGCMIVLVWCLGCGWCVLGFAVCVLCCGQVCLVCFCV